MIEDKPTQPTKAIYIDHVIWVFTVRWFEMNEEIQFSEDQYVYDLRSRCKIYKNNFSI